MRLGQQGCLVRALETLAMYAVFKTLIQDSSSVIDWHTHLVPP